MEQRLHCCTRSARTLPNPVLAELYRTAGAGSRRVDPRRSPAGAISIAASQSVVGRYARQMSARPAVVLLSGGLDSATVLALAVERGFRCHALSVRYGQRHSVELDAAERVAAQLGAHEHRIMAVDLAGIGGSALTDTRLPVPESPTTGIPITYVPARNTLFLALALGWAEVLGAEDLFVGVNAVDYSGYPDCRPEFIAAFEQLARLATKAGVEGTRVSIQAPLIRMS